MTTTRKTPLPVRETYYVPRSTANMLASLCQQSGRPHNLAEVAGVLELAIEVGGAYIVSVRGDNWITGNIATDDDIKRLIENCSRPVERAAAAPADYTPLDLAAFEGHSPEPWRQRADKTIILAGECAIAMAYFNERQTQPHGCTVPGFREALANSALFAAAPQLLRERNELLAALKDIIEDCADSHSYIDLLNKIEFGKIEPWGNQ